jgi:hypothetical protein
VAIKLAGTTAVKVVSQTNVVFSRAEPHFDVEVGVKLPPPMVNVNAAPPAVAETGLRLVIAGGWEAIEALTGRPVTIRRRLRLLPERVSASAGGRNTSARLTETGTFNLRKNECARCIWTPFEP